MMDLKGVAFLAFTGAGAFIGGFISLLLFAGSLLSYGSFQWFWVPMVVGAGLGAMFGIIAEMQE